MKSCRFQFSYRAEIEFSILPTALQKRILEKLYFFQKAENPLHFAKKLQGREGRFRFRIGDYRVIVEKRDNDVVVILVILKIGHRREVYE